MVSCDAAFGDTRRERFSKRLRTVRLMISSVACCRRGFDKECLRLG